MDAVSPPFDAITLEVLWTRLISVVDEAAKAIVRTSFSTLSNEANDFACMLTDARGYSLAQNTGSIPSFIGTLPATVRHFLRAMGPTAMRPGDVLITNDAWMGTGHMSDVSVLKPIFRAGRLVAFSATTSHMPDIGGRLRAIEAREVFEEGLHIPLMKLIREGRADDTLIEMIRANVRTPDQTVGDIWAQVGANELMEKRLLALMDAARLESLDALGDELFSRAERAMREAIRAVPDGTYRYAMRTDGVDEPLDYRVALTIAADEITADYAGTSPQQPRAINCVLAYTYAMTAYAIKCALLPGLANNEGMYRPMRVTAPEGCLLNPRFPAAVVSRAVTGHYVPVLLFGALHQVVPDRVMAGAGSPLWAVQQTGRERALVAEQYLVDARRGRRAQQSALFQREAAASRIWRARPLPRRARPGHRLRVRVGRADRRLVHGRAHEVRGAWLRGRWRRRARRRPDQRGLDRQPPPARPQAR